MKSKPLSLASFKKAIDAMKRATVPMGVELLIPPQSYSRLMDMFTEHDGARVYFKGHAL
jgi:hypothetical protein